MALEVSTVTTLSADEQAPARELVAELAGNSSLIGADMANHLHERVPEFALAADQRALLAETEASCTANVDQILTQLGRGGPPHVLAVPEPALEYARGLVHRHTPLVVLLRAYRLGHGYLSSITSRALRDGIEDERVLLSAIEASSTFMFEYIDIVSDQLVAAYHVERDSWVRTAAAIRAETVRNLIDGQITGERAASTRLGYDLRRHHIGLILSGEPQGRPGGINSLEREATEAAAILGCADPLLIPAGAAALWAWCGTFQRPAADALAALEIHRPPEGVRMAVGRPARGIEGFRTTHLEAGHAARFWTVNGSGATGTTSYRSIEVVSLLASDLDRARRFVASELGPLAEQTDTAAQLRSTVLSFLTHGFSHTRAAQALHMHHNTVYNRVRRAEELLGAPVTERHIEVQTALLLAETLGAEVLT